MSIQDKTTIGEKNSGDIAYKVATQVKREEILSTSPVNGTLNLFINRGVFFHG